MLTSDPMDSFIIQTQETHTIMLNIETLKSKQIQTRKRKSLKQNKKKAIFFCVNQHR